MGYIYICLSNFSCGKTYNTILSATKTLLIGYLNG